MTQKKLILASSSVARVALLGRLGIKPDIIEPADIDETPHKKEIARDLALRLALEKAKKIASLYKDNSEEYIILSGDTVVTKGRFILPKGESDQDVRMCMEKLSGGNHRIYTGICVINQKANKINTKVVETRVKFKHLSSSEIDKMVLSKEGIGKAGGYSINGLAESFIVRIIGSVSNVIGLPTRETVNLLVNAGYAF